VAEIVLHHHERFSGGGYPTGISGEAIPLGSRIISAADTYDVMTSRDSYRRPVSSEAALAELRRVAGTQLDPPGRRGVRAHDPRAPRQVLRTPTPPTSSPS
jgi:HD-GYP domain-containing protein (c-di-GMP phosphodiesterase class II)